MGKGELTKAFIESIAKMTDGATVKVCKGDKTLFELDGSVIRGALDAAEKYAMMEEQDEKRRKIEQEYYR